MGKPKRPNISPSVARLELSKRQQWFDLAARFVKYGTYIALAYFGAQSISDLAGSQTTVDLLVSWMANEASLCTIAITFGGGGVAFGVLERREKRLVIERLAARNKELECRHDPQRSSSRLAPDGRTNPSDTV